MKRSTTKRSGKRLITACGLIAALILVNLAAGLLPFRVKHPDVSGKTTYQISDSTVRYLSSLNSILTSGETVELVYHCSEGLSGTDEDLYPFLLGFADVCKHVTVSRAADADTASTQTVEVRSSRRSRILKISELYYYSCSASGELLTLEEYARVRQMISAAMQGSDETSQQTYTLLTQLYAPSTVSAVFSGDANLTGAIRYVLAEETPLILAYSAGKNAGMHLFFRQALEQAGCEVREPSSLADIPAECRLICLDATADLSSDDASALRTWLASGGKLFLTTSAGLTDTPELTSLLNTYGLSVPAGAGLIMESGYPYFYATAGNHAINRSFGANYAAVYPHPIQITETEGVSVSVLLRSSTASYYTVSEAETSQTSTVAGSAPMCVLAEKDGSAVLWLSMQLDGLAVGFSGGADTVFATHCVSHLTGATPPSSAPSARAVPTDLLSAGSTALIFWVLIFVLLIPGSLIAIGGIRYYARKKRG